MNSIAPGESERLLHLDVDRLAEDLHGPGWSVHPRALGFDACRALREAACAERNHGSFRAAGIGRGKAWRLDPALRGDEVLWVQAGLDDSIRQSVFGEFRRLGPELNRRLYMGLVDYEAHFAVYPPGKAYGRHRDHFRGSESRLVTTTLYLNDEWEASDGGELRIFVPDAAPVEILPVGGTLVVFLSQDFEHEVLPARRERWSWTGWFRRNVRV